MKEHAIAPRVLALLLGGALVGLSCGDGDRWSEQTPGDDYTAGPGISIDAGKVISVNFGTDPDQVAPGDHTHDDRYVPATVLADDTGTVNSPANPVDWSQLKNVPADLLDGDDGQAYVAGPGITISGANEISVDFGAVAAASHSHDADYVNVTGDTMTGPLVLDEGAGAPAVFGETGIDRASAGDETFDIQNSGSGSMTLRVQGNKVWHEGNDGSGSGLDADLLDGQDSTAFAAAGHSHTGADIVSGTIDIARLPVGTGPGTVAAGDHTHTGYASSSHGSTHAEGGPDAVPNATAVTGGLMSAADKAKLDGIEPGADVTDAVNVEAAGALMESDFVGSDGFMRKVAPGTFEVVKANLAASVAPGPTDDSAAGYAVGSVWVDTTNGRTYVCVDAAPGAAVWKETSNAGESGTVTEVNTGAGLVGGPITTSGTIGLRLKSGGGLVSNLGVGANELGLIPGDADGRILKWNALAQEWQLGDDAGGGGVVGGSGTAGYVSRWTDANNIGNSAIYQDASSNVGVGTTTPGARLDVVGGSIRTDGQVVSTVGTGTAPFAVSSTTTVTNLSADLLDGQDSTAFAAAAHDHDARYYTETEVDGLLAGKSDTGHTHAEYVAKAGDTMTGPLVLPGDPTAALEAATKQYVDAGLGAKADTGHTHAGADITSGTIADARLSPNVMLLGSAQTVSGPKTFVAPPAFDPSLANTPPFTVGANGTGLVVNLNADKVDGMDASAFAAAVHDHDARYYTKTEADGLLAGKSDTGHTHAEYVAKAGDTMTGALTLSGDPTLAGHAATKGYVDTGLAGKADAGHGHAEYLPLVGGTMTGSISMGGTNTVTGLVAPSGASDAATKGYVDTGLAGKSDIGHTHDFSGDFVNVTGDTMTGPLTLSGDPTLAGHAATKGYVDGQIGSHSHTQYVAKAGDTMTGMLAVEQSAPEIDLRETDQALPAGRWRFRLEGDALGVEKSTDGTGTFTTYITPLAVTSAGVTQLSALRLPTGASSGYVLTSDASGNASWAAAPGANAFVNGGNSFGGPAVLGTNDTYSLSLRTGGVNRVFVSASGQVGIGTSVPAAQLHVEGDARIESASPALAFRENDRALPAGLWRVRGSDGWLHVERNTAAAGDFSTFEPAMQLSDSGILYAPNIMATVSSWAPFSTVESFSPSYRFRESDQTLPNGLWRTRLDDNAYRLERNLSAVGDFSTFTTPLVVDASDRVTVSAFCLQTGAGAGKVLTSDASGNASWQDAPGANSWGLYGNAGTVPGTNFIGTTDNAALEVKVNALRAMRIEPTSENDAPNIIAGHGSNSVTAGAVGVTIGGGGYNDGANTWPNRVTDHYGTVAGGYNNRAGNDDADLGNAYAAAVGGGYGNNASGGLSTVSGGWSNTAQGSYSTVGGGYSNNASGWYSTVGGGMYNTAQGWYSTVGGGDNNTAQGDYSFAAGRQAKANHQGAFVWADSQDADFVSSANDQFLIRAQGGVGVNTNDPAGAALRVNGMTTTNGLTVAGGSPSAGKVLTAVDGTGLAQWSTPSGTIGGTGTTNRLAKFTGASTIGDSVIYDDGTLVGIGTSTPSAKLTVVTDGTATEGSLARASDDTSGPMLVLQKSRGTPGAPAALSTNDDMLGLLLGQGYDGNSFETGAVIGIASEEDAGWSDSRRGTRIIFMTTPKGSTTLRSSMRIKGDGFVGINTDDPTSYLDVNGTVTATGFKLPTGAGAGKVLTSDASGNASWQDAPGGNAWNIGGNALPGDSSIGSTNNYAVNVIANSARVMRYEPNATSPNVIGGYSGNGVTSGVYGATIGGGGGASQFNRVTDNYGTVGGGVNNQAGNNAGDPTDSVWATVGGGMGNRAVGMGSTVAGGVSNQASNMYANVGGGAYNVASGFSGVVPGGAQNVAAGDYSFAAGRRAKVDALHHGTFLWADQTDLDFDSAVANEFAVRATGGVRFVTDVSATGVPASGITITDDGSGSLGYATTKISTIDSDHLEFAMNGVTRLAINAASGVTSVKASFVAEQSSRLGGSLAPPAWNVVGTGTASHTATGELENASDIYVTDDLEVDGTIFVDGGLTIPSGAGAGKVLTSDASGNASWQDAPGGNAWNIGGNALSGDSSIGSTNNYAVNVIANSARVMRYEPNATSPNVIGGYLGNWVQGGAYGAVIAGGGASTLENIVYDHYGVVGGGRYCRAGSNDGNAGNATFATVGGGENNAATASWSTIAGGRINQASAEYATVGGGDYSRATGDHSTVSGGWNNLASGTAATVPGGMNNSAQGMFAFAAGQRAKANHQGAFVWADSQDADFVSSANDQFLIRAQGGVGVNTNDPAGAALRVNGMTTTNGLTVAGGSPSAGKVLTAVDGTGLAQWSTPSGTIGGTGTTNRLAKFTDASTIGDSVIYDDGAGHVGINTTTPGAGLEVAGAGIWQSAIGINNTLSAMNWRLNVTDIGGDFAFTKIPGATATPVRFKADSPDNSLVVTNTGVGVRTSAPATALDVNGTVTATGFKLPTGAGMGKVLTSDASGNATWQDTPGGNSWGLYGNAGTVPGTNFIGTTDNQALEVKVNALRAMRIEPTGASYAPNIVAGHWSNSVTAGAFGATIGGGGYNDGATVCPNRVTDNYGTVAGGYNNRAGDDDADLGDAYASTVGGGGCNTAQGGCSTVGGGYGNIASGELSTVGGGSYNTASFDFSTVSGGENNSANHEYTTIGGGQSNTASAWCSTISGGQLNTVSGTNAAVGGGFQNSAQGAYSTVPGGNSNTAQGDYSFAAGRRAKANHQGAFVWADSQDADFVSSANDQFLIRAQGGVGIGTADTSGTLLNIYKNGTTDSGTWYGEKVDRRGMNTTTAGYGIHATAQVYDGGGVGGTFCGVYGAAKFGSSNCGVMGEITECSSSAVNYGVYGRAVTTQGSTNYGVYGAASGAATNWAGYFAGNVRVGGDVKLGPSGEYYAPGGEENLRMLRGSIASDGSVVRGSGFTSSRLGTGRYRISFNTSFSSIPSAVASIYGSSAAGEAVIDASATTYVDIRTYNSSGLAADQAFEFIVMGPR